MIRNLNQINFQNYGTILPERTTSTSPFPRDQARTLVLDADALLYLSTTETWVAGKSGSCILSVFSENNDYLHFYLDKPVCLKAGIRFAVSAFLGDASVLIYAAEYPQGLGISPNEKLRMDRRLRIDGIYTFFYQEKEQGFLFPGESHPFPELTYVDGGELHSVVDGQDLLLKQGDLVIYGPNQWHMQYADIGVAPRFVIISFDMKGLELTPLLNRRIQAPQRAAELLQSMLREQERMDDVLSPDMIVAYLNLLLLLLFRTAIQPGESNIRNANIVQNENEIIRRAQQYITAHIREKLSVPAVAAKVEVSPSYLTVLFHKNLQLSPGEYIRRIKLQESKQLIRENNMNFTEIAAALNYSTVHHFSRQFKEKFGLTPTEYARSVR